MSDLRDQYLEDSRRKREQEQLANSEPSLKFVRSGPDGEEPLPSQAEPTINPKYMKPISPDEVKKFKNPEAQGAE